MPDITIIQPMTRDEAITCIQSLKRDLQGARRKAIEFKERAGWKALGYESLALCLESELGYSFQHGYRLLAAAEVERDLLDSHLGESIPTTLPERHARVLSRLKTPAERVKAYGNAQSMATSEGESAVTTRHIEQSVRLVEIERQVIGSKYNPIAHAMTTGVITPPVALAMVQAVEDLVPKKRGYIMQLLAKHGLTCADLIAPIAAMFDRPPGKESYVLPEILNAGTLGGTPLSKATLADLNRANYEARQQHITDAQEAKRTAQPDWFTQPETVNLALTFGGDVDKLRQQLQVLADGQRGTVLRLLMEE
jgi:hypothetical protein